MIKAKQQTLARYHLQPQLEHTDQSALNTSRLTAIKTASTQTKPAYALLKTQIRPVVCEGRLCLYSRELNSPQLN